MIGIRTAALAPVLALALATACSSSGGNSPASTTPPTGSATSSTATSTAGSGSAAPGSAAAAALAATLRKGLAGLTSAHVAADAGQLGGTSAGDVTYADGKATASDVTVTSGSSRTRLLTVGDVTYAKLPAGQNNTGKPWVKVTATSKNQFVRALSGSLDISKSAASLPAVADLAATSTDVERSGSTYSLQVHPAKVSGSSLAQLLASVGQEQVPVRVTLDGKGRPTHIVISIKLGAQSLPVTIDVTKFDAPVKITAPPSSQVAS